MSGDCRCLGALCGLSALERIGRGKLSLCFNSLGNIVFTSKANEPRTVRDCSGLFGVVRVCSGLFGGFRGLFGVWQKTLPSWPKTYSMWFLILFNGIDDFWVEVLERDDWFKKGRDVHSPSLMTSHSSLHPMFPLVLSHYISNSPLHFLLF